MLNLRFQEIVDTNNFCKHRQQFFPVNRQFRVLSVKINSFQSFVFPKNVLKSGEHNKMEHNLNRIEGTCERTNFR